MEKLEQRIVFAQATALSHTFREDDFSIAGTFTYQLREPDEFDYIDTINNGQYTSTSGHVKWTSPTVGKGFFEGKATGDGRDTVEFAGRRNCSEYGIEDIGRFDFTVETDKSSLKIDKADATSTRYTYYRDLTGGFCEQPDPPWSRFFGGFSRSYIGSFSSSTHKAAITYDQDSPDMQVNSPAADVQWSVTSANEISVSARPTPSTLSVPDGFIEIEQTTFPPSSLAFVDVRNGGLEFTANLTGKPIKTTTPQVPVATIKIYWADSADDFSGTEIPLTSTEPLGLYWNSAQSKAEIRQFPARPSGADFIRITISGPAGLDGNATNNTVFLPIGEFDARSGTSVAVSEDGEYDGSTDSILHPLDRSDGVRVYAYQPDTELGGTVEVFDDLGSFHYTVGGSEEIQKLGVGETVTDKVRFIAIKDQLLLDETTLSIPIQGQNDEPYGEGDFASTTNFVPIQILPSTILANDVDPDRNDVLRLNDADATSSAGAQIQIVWNDAQTEIRHLVYDPSTSATLRALGFGEKTEDSFGYEIIDPSGAVGFGFVQIEITGEERRLTVSAVDPKFTTSGVSTAPFQVTVEDFDSDPSDVTLTVTPADPTLVPASGIDVTKTDGDFTVTLTPSAGLSGRTRVELTARNSVGHTATTSFLLTVGTETDLDLDGVDNETENAAPNSGDMNADGVLDSTQGNVASLRTHHGDSYFNLSVGANQILVDVVADDNPLPAGDASNAAFPIGLVRFDVLVESAEAAVTIVARTDHGSMPLNRLFANLGSSWTSLMFNKRDGAKIFQDRVEISARDGGRGDADTEQARYGVSIALGNVLHPWQNIVREDVDNDGNIVPLDALILINQINNFGPRLLGKTALVDQALMTFLDPSGSDSIEPIDALIVINFLNNRALAEGESLLPTPISVESDSIHTLSPFAFVATGVRPHVPPPVIPESDARAPSDSEDHGDDFQLDEADEMEDLFSFLTQVRSGARTRG